MFDLFGKKKKLDREEILKYPKIKDLIVQAEEKAKERTPHIDQFQAPSDEILKILSKLSKGKDIKGLKMCNIKEIDEFSPLFGRQIRTSILLGLIEAGFSQKELEEKYEIRHGTTLGDNYYFLNLKSQTPISSNVKAVNDDELVFIDQAETSRIQFVSVITIGNEESAKEDIAVSFDLIIGRAHLLKA